MSNAGDPDLSGKQMDRYNIVGFPAEKLPPKIANHSISAPSQEVLFSP
jgi:serine/threonine-protein kinase OSR1/STK39